MGGQGFCRACQTPRWSTAYGRNTSCAFLFSSSQRGYSACPAYFNRAANDLGKEQLLAIVEAFRANEQFQKGKPQNFLYPKGFRSVLSLAKEAKYELAFLILNDILLRSENGSQFTDGCKKSFKTTIKDTNGLTFIQKLYEVISADNFEAKSMDKRRFNRFLDAVVDGTVTTATTVVEAPQVQAEKALQAEPAKKEEQAFVPTEKGEKPKNSETQISIKSLDKIESTQSEILTMLRKLTENRTKIDTLALQIQKKDAEIAPL